MEGVLNTSCWYRKKSRV